MSKPPKRIANREAYERMNFLYQAAHVVDTGAGAGNGTLSRFYLHSMKTISKRLVIRLDPELKRAVCKECSSLLTPGTSATVRVHGNRGKKGRRVHVTCNTCGRFKRTPAREGFTTKLQDKKAEHVAAQARAAANPQKGGGEGNGKGKGNGNGNGKGKGKGKGKDAGNHTNDGTSSDDGNPGTATTAGGSAGGAGGGAGGVVGAGSGVLNKETKLERRARLRLEREAATAAGPIAENGAAQVGSGAAADVKGDPVTQVCKRPRD